MKKSVTLSAFLLVMLMGCHHVFSQQVTVTLNPGWNWIAFTRAEITSISEALGSFSPTEGDVFKGQDCFSIYQNGQWNGSLEWLIPGYGYMYLWQGVTPVELSFFEPIPQLLVTTIVPSEITAVSAQCGGHLASGDGGYVSVTVKGVCWSETPEPTVNDHYVELESGGIGEFSVTISGLEANTTYYVRAFAVADGVTFFGEQQSFTTKNGVPFLITAEVTAVESTWALGGGTVIDDGVLIINKLGICWSVSHNPTIADNYAVCNDLGSVNFILEMTNLIPNTTYYARAYAINSSITSYGNEVSFTTIENGGNDHEYVDLGLPSGTLWATCNVGAESPEDYGDYFAWGETEPKDYYDWSVYFVSK